MLARPTISVFVLVVMVLVCVSSICLVPAGQGPFSAAHGPVTALRARRAAFRLMYWISALVAAVVGFETASVWLSGWRERTFDKVPETPHHLSLICTLQC